MSIPQNAIPVTIRGHPYVIEIDEFGNLDEVGAGRIIDIRNERKSRVVSNLRLEVHQEENFDRLQDDRGTDNSLGGYAGHYCNVPWRTDPGIVACSMILSGLRVFDIRDPRHPKEVAYFNSPLATRAHPELFFPSASNWAMSSPAFVPRRREIWYSDGYNGFFAVRVTNGAWAFARRSEPAHCRGRSQEDESPKDESPQDGQGDSAVVQAGSDKAQAKAAGKRSKRKADQQAEGKANRHHDRRSECGRSRDDGRRPDDD